MKKLTDKTVDKDQGIAIIFSLIMLTIFFFLAFGFLAVGSSANDAAQARSPQNSADLLAQQRVFTQAMGAFEAKNGLLTDAQDNFLTAPDPTKLLSADFTNPDANVSKNLPFYAWRTKGNSIDIPLSVTSQLDNSIKMHFQTGTDIPSCR